MKLIICSLILFAVAFGEIFSQNFEAPIKNVLVYSDRAQVTRKTKLNVQPGEITYKVTELPAVLSDETLQASFPGEKNLRVSSVNSYIELTNSYNDASLDELKNQIESHEKTRKRIISNLENIRAEKSGVSGFENLTVDTISRQAAYSRSEAELPNWKESLSFFRRKNLEIERELHENEISLIRTEESLRILNLKLDSIISKSGKSKRITEIKISNSSKLPVSSELLISYIVPNSSWKPVYNISKTGKNLIEIEYLAEIYQESGENWKNVKIALSTAEPKKAQGRPRIRSQELYNITTEKKSENLFTYRREANAPATEAEKPVAETEPGNAPSVDGEVARTGGSFTFNASETATIPTGKESHRILISRFTSNSSEELAAIPKLSRFVYTTEKIKNKISFPLLPGKANLIKDSGYVGETSIPYFPPGNEFTISYGIENTIRLSYKTENRNDTEGIVTNRKLTNKNVIITIENFDNSQKTINLSDQVPVSDIEEVEIEINRTKTTPGYTEKIKNSGILHWVITIPPNSKKEVILNFNIRTPANSNLNF